MDKVDSGTHISVGRMTLIPRHTKVACCIWWPSEPCTASTRSDARATKIELRATRLPWHKAAQTPSGSRELRSTPRHSPEEDSSFTCNVHLSPCSGRMSNAVLNTRKYPPCPKLFQHLLVDPRYLPWGTRSRSRATIVVAPGGQFLLFSRVAGTR